MTNPSERTSNDATLFESMGMDDTASRRFLQHHNASGLARCSDCNATLRTDGSVIELQHQSDGSHVTVSNPDVE